MNQTMTKSNIIEYILQCNFLSNIFSVDETTSKTINTINAVANVLSEQSVDNNLVSFAANNLTRDDCHLLEPTNNLMATKISLNPVVLDYVPKLEFAFTQPTTWVQGAASNAHKLLSYTYTTNCKEQFLYLLNLKQMGTAGFILNPLQPVIEREFYFAHLILINL